MRRLLRITAILLGAAACLVWAAAAWLERPRGLRVTEGADARPPYASRHAEFWAAVRDFDLDAAGHVAESPEQRDFAAALRDTAEGRRDEAIEGFLSLFRQAEEQRVRDESREALIRLLRAEGRWEQLLEVEPGSYEAAAFGGAQPEEISYPDEPVRLPTRIGWLRVPRMRVGLNGRTYTFAVDTGADPTVITDEVAEECGITPSAEATVTHTSTSAKVEWRAGIAREMRLGGIVFRNHRVAVVKKADLDLGLVQLDGIVGWPAFERLRVKIDYGAGVTTLSEPTKEQKSEPRNLFWLGYPMVRLYATDGTPLYFGLDTGARDTSLNEDGPRKLGLAAQPGGRRLSIGAGGAEARNTFRVADFSFRLSGRRLSFERISVKDGVKDLAVFSPDGRLGGDVAFGGTMTIDFANGRFDLDVPLRD